jgi:hypothetical protein
MRWAPGELGRRDWRRQAAARTVPLITAVASRLARASRDAAALVCDRRVIDFGGNPWPNLVRSQGVWHRAIAGFKALASFGMHGGGVSGHRRT